MQINTNVAALNAYRNLNTTQQQMDVSLERLSSGHRINRAADDAAGLSISEKMRGQIGGLDQAVRNTQDGVSLIQTAEGALEESHDILNRMRELAVQSSNDSLTDADRADIQAEVDELAEELSRISETTEFNTMELLDGTYDNNFFHIGANEGQNMEIGIGNMSADALGVAEDGRATLEVTSGDVDTDDTALAEEGDYELDVVDFGEIYNVDGEDEATYARYGLQNEDGEIVAVSEEGETYNILEEAATMEDIEEGEASVSDAEIEFDLPVISGTVELTVSDVEGNGTEIAEGDITATGTIEFDGQGTSLPSGEAEVVEDDDDLAEAAVEAGLINDTDSFAEDVWDGGLVNEQGELIAVYDDEDDSWYNVEDVDVTEGPGDADYVFQAELGEEAVLEAGDVLNISAVGGIDVSSQSAADSAITTIDDAVNDVSDQRSELGAIQNRLEHTARNLEVASENLTASESHIRDTDFSLEMVDFTRHQIMQEAGTSMLAQANMVPQNVMALLQ